MWFFYAVAVPTTLGMVGTTLKYFAAPSVSFLVLFTVGYAWFCTVSIIILVPVDIWNTLSPRDTVGNVLGSLWSWSYWSTFCLTWLIVPTLQGYEDAGDFTVSKRLKTGIRGNLILYASVGVVSFIGVLILIYMNRLKWDGVMALAMACSNTFGLVTGAFLLGFGLVEIPRSQWRNADLQYRQKYLTHRIARVAVKLDDAHQELSTAIVVAQATSNQMARHDPLRPCMDIVESMLEQLAKEDPQFKPSGGRLGESDMDYDTDEKTMAALRRRLRKAQNAYYRYKSDYAGYVWEALELEETVKNLERGKSSPELKFVSTIHPVRTGVFAQYLDMAEYAWRCIMRQPVIKAFAVLLVIMSFALIFAEATLLYGKDLSLFSHLIKLAGQQEILVQAFAFIPLMYMCICTYFSLIKLGMMTIYYLAPKQTSSVSLLMICSMVARYAAPMSYNFLNLIRLDPSGEMQTTFERKMGTIDQVPIIGGDRFQNMYPMFMVIYTGLLASNVIHRIIYAFGSWRRFRSDYEDAEGYDPSGLVILRKERSWLEQGGTVGENVVPLARNFGNIDVDVEADDHLVKKTPPETVQSSKVKESALDSKNKVGRTFRDPRDTGGKATKDGSGNGLVRGIKDNLQPQSSRDAIAAKYSGVRDPKSQQKASSADSTRPFSKPPQATVSTSNDSNGHIPAAGPPGTRWDTMKSFQTFSTMRLAPLRQGKDPPLPETSSSDTLDSIFQGLRSKRQPSELDEDSVDLRLLR